MLVMACGVIKAMALHEEPIRLRISPPSATIVRAFMAVRDGELSGTQPQTPNMKEEPQPSISDPHQGGRTPHQFQADLGDAELWQLMEDLCWEVVLRELNAPPRDPPPTPGDQWDMGTLMWMTRRSPF